MNFNNISFISDLIYDSSLNKIMINNTINFDEYNIKIEKYTVKEKSFSFVIAGINFSMPNMCKNSIDSENQVEIVDPIKNNTCEVYEY